VHPVCGPRYRTTLPEAERKPACVLACPANARLFGDVHDPESVVSKAITERGGYQLMPEWGTKPSNHYLPRRKTEMRIHPEDLERVDNPLKIDGKLPDTRTATLGREDFAT
jgi:Fe-S-cluster-containing dehydrogenase component